MIRPLIIKHNKAFFNLVDADLIILFGSSLSRPKSIFDFHMHHHWCSSYNDRLSCTTNSMHAVFERVDTNMTELILVDWTMLTGSKLNFSFHESYWWRNNPRWPWGMLVRIWEIFTLMSSGCVLNLLGICFASVYCYWSEIISLFFTKKLPCVNNKAT